MTEIARLLAEDLPDRRVLRASEVATWLRVSAKTIYRWCDMGLIDSVKLNGTVRVLRDSVINFIEDRAG